MKVVVPYVHLHPATVAALERDGIEARYVDVSSDVEDAWQLLAECWAAGEGFAVVEQDKVPAPGALPALIDCPERWCAYPVSMQSGTYAGFPTLSCAKFAGDLMARWPDLMNHVGGTFMGVLGGQSITGRHYARLDMAVALWVARRSGPVHWHPAGMVEHLHQSEESS